VITATRISSDPIIAPGSVAGYGALFNAGVIHHDGAYHLFVRGVRSGYKRNPGNGARFLNYISDILAFRSTDGMSYEYRGVLAESNPDEVYCYEDPRVQRVRTGDGEEFMMTYTDLPSPESGLPWRVGIHRLIYEQDGFRLNRHSGQVIGPPGVPDKDAVLFNLSDGRVALLHRIHPDMQLAVFGSLGDLLEADSSYWDHHLANIDRHTLIKARPEVLGIGAGAPPLESEAGLLLFYHERNADGVYTAHVALLDRHSGHVLSILPHPILVPELAWELEGDVDRVIFIQGAHRRPDGTIYLTYGGADHAVGAALIDEADLLEALAA
jgi:predicted GH43/DUF377 family glycosyl hydrolase